MNQHNHHKEIRVIQIIDSLDAGGGERMAVNLANSLSYKVKFSGLVVTRKEGALLNAVNQEVTYCFLNKKKKIDLKALKKLVHFIQSNNINTIHAHSTSFFTATLVKLIKPKLKLIWHDHHGNRPNEKSLMNNTLKISSYKFDYVIACSQTLYNWAHENLKTKSISLINNFVMPFDMSPSPVHKNDYIICVANLRSPKDHFTLVKAFSIVRKTINIDLILLGEDRKDDYSLQLRELIAQEDIERSVHILGQVSNVANHILQAKIGILTSTVEGLPMALLEYAKAGLPVVVTDVGQCKEVVGTNAQVVPKNNPDLLAKAIKYYLDNSMQAKQDAVRLSKKVHEEYGEQKIINSIKEVYKKVLSS